MFQTSPNDILIDQDLILIQNDPPIIEISEDEDDEENHNAKIPKLIQIPEYEPSTLQHQYLDNAIPDVFTVKFLPEDLNSRINLPPEEITLKEQEAVPIIKFHTRKQKLRRGERFKRRNPIEQDQFYHCDICFKKLNSPLSLENHKAVHISGKKIFECSKCLRSYSVARVTYCYFCTESPAMIFFQARQSSEPVQKKVEAKPRAYILARNQYDSADKFEPIPAVNKPIKCYLGARKHVCKICDATFFTSNTLEAHHLVHMMDVKVEPTDLLEICIKEEEHHNLITLKSEDS